MIKSIHKYLECFKRVKNTTWLFIAQIMLTFMIGIMYSLSSGRYADFYPINGTFQNYNPVRRLLSGQIPYRDFQDYLGLGHLYFGALFTKILGGGYRDSLIAFTFLSIAGFALMSYLIGTVIFGKKEMAGAATNILLVCLIAKTIIFSNALVETSEVLGSVTQALKTGNSARFLRGMILPMLCFMVWMAYRLFVLKAFKIRWIQNHRECIAYLGVGLLGGFAFAYSNDYGISSWLCLIIISFWTVFSRTRNFIRAVFYTLIEFAGSIVGLFCCVEIFTVGHFSEWFRSTFGTGGYQGWYYNGEKSFYLSDVEFSFLTLLQASICIIYLIKVFKARGNKTSLRRYGILAYCNMVSFCAVNEYHMISGGTSHEVAFSILFLNIFYEICWWISNRSKREGAILQTVSTVLTISLIIATAKNEFVFKYTRAKEGTYVEALGGNLKEHGEDLLRTDEYLDGEQFFSTYASAQEVVSDTFQPSGTDYIIHVLGDMQRQEYLNCFVNGDFRYAATIKETFTPWEYWIQRANWFFYRELYQNWHPVFANDYEVYWERNEASNENTLTNGFNVQVVDIDETSKKIVVEADSTVNGIADVYIDYQVNKIDNKKKWLVWKTLLMVRNTGTVYASEEPEFYESNYLRAASAEYIPIRVVNGYGEVTLSSQPALNTYLTVDNVQCTQIFLCTSKYVEIEDITRSEQNEENSVIAIRKNRQYEDIIANAHTIQVEGIDYEIKDISNNEKYIYIFVEYSVDYHPEKGNYMKIW